MTTTMLRVFLFLLSILSLISCCKESDDTENEFLISYLSNNNSEIDTSIIYNENEFTLISSDIEKYSVFLFGEIHAILFNEVVDVKLLKYLYYNANVKYYLAESAYSNAALINKYVQTGDIANLDYVYNILKQQGTFGGNQSSYDKWKIIYEFNSTLPDNDKITIVGTDLEHQVDVAYYYLNSLLPESNPAQEINDMIDKIKNYKQIPTSKEMYDFGVQLNNNVIANSEAYQDYLKENYFEFKFVVSNINKTRKYKFPVLNDSIREAGIYENFIEINQHLPDGNYYGKWGREHVIQNFTSTMYNTINENRFAIYLNSDTSDFKNKVMSIVGTYINCNYLSPNNGYHIVPVFDGYLNKDLIDFNNSNIQLFKLDSEDSPFQNNLYFLDNGLSNSTIDYFQYVLKIKNSPACEEYLIQD